MKPLIVLTFTAWAFAAGTQPIPLDASTPMRKVNVKVEAVSYKGRAAVRLTDIAAEDANSDEGRIAMLTGTDCENGTIEAELAGDRIPGTPESGRGFTGIVFRVDPKDVKSKRYEVFYLRPHNGRAAEPSGSVHRASGLYVEKAALQPMLIVNDLKHGAGRGPVALLISVWAVGHFANLKVTR